MYVCMLAIIIIKEERGHESESKLGEGGAKERGEIDVNMVYCV